MEVLKLPERENVAKEGVNSELLLDDRMFAEAMLMKEQLGNADLTFALRNLLKLEYYPVAVKFFYLENEIEQFKNANGYRIAARPYTFCHFSAASRQRGDVLFGEKETMGCTNAKYNFGWKELDEDEIKSHVKYTRDREQAERFVKTKPRLPEGLLAFATAPLHKATFEPDIIHIICNVLQAYHIANDYASAMDEHPVETAMLMNSAVCGGATWSYVNQKLNLVPMCSSSYTAGKTEQGEINVYIPWKKFRPTVRRLLERTLQYGGASFPRTGETFPGFNVCKLCNFLAFVKPKN
ncbi:MAG: DUF169 domain-containing protein [Armatimonadetes bacterium]|nr:DUF169 domain-containing protein [Armatimonadota bacterium]